MYTKNYSTEKQNLINEIPKANKEADNLYNKVLEGYETSRQWFLEKNSDAQASHFCGVYNTYKSFNLQFENLIPIEDKDLELDAANIKLLPFIFLSPSDGSEALAQYLTWTLFKDIKLNNVPSLQKLLLKGLELAKKELSEETVYNMMLRFDAFKICNPEPYHENCWSHFTGNYDDHCPISRREIGDNEIDEIKYEIILTKIAQSLNIPIIALDVKIPLEGSLSHMSQLELSVLSHKISNMLSHESTPLIDGLLTLLKSRLSPLIDKDNANTPSKEELRAAYANFYS